jgi:phosphoribosylanthranilate isomerase
MTVRVKICGLTRPEDVAAAVAAGADFVGFVLEQSSPRSVTAERAAELAADVPAHVRTVAVVASGDGPEPPITDLVQTYEPHGPLHRTIVATRGAPPAGVPADVPLVLDLAFGSAPDAATLAAHWRRAAEQPGRVMLAGSLTPQNVAAAIAAAHPWAVDTARGVETAPGIKDHDLIREFVTNAKEATS